MYAAFAQPPDSLRLSLEDCLDYAMGNNFTRQQLLLSEQSAEADYRQAKRERLPDVSASLSEGVGHGTGAAAAWSGSAGVDASVTLYQGGSIGYTIEQNRLQAERAAYQTAQYDNQLTIQILQSFLSVLGYEELLKYQEAVIAASEEQLKQGREQYAAGKILESDFLLLEAQLAGDRNNAADTRANRENGLLALKGLLAMDMHTALQIVPPDTPALAGMQLIPAREAVLERAMSVLPDVEALRYGVRIAEAGLKLSRAGYLPTVSLYAGVSTGHQDYASLGTQLSDRFSQQAGVRLSIPIFSKGQTQTRVLQSKLSLRQAELDRQQGELTLAQTVLQEYLNVGAALEKYATARVKEHAYRRTFEAYRVQFNAGAITAVELLQQQNNYISALNDYVQSKYGFLLKRKILDVYMGEAITMNNEQ
jgi:outer membrane protein